MGEERIINFDGLGEVNFKKSKRARRLTIRVKTEKDVNVTIPFHVSYRQAESFVREKILRKIREGKILVSVPFTQVITAPDVQAKIRLAILETWRKEAKAILPGRIDELAKNHGFQYRSLSIKNMKTRWGSCTGQNGINLNLHLVRLPDHLCDYIILHELVHTIHKNHGKYFWATLDKHCGDARGKAQELKRFRLEIW